MATTTDVPGRWPVALNGVGYVLFEQGDQPALAHQSLRVQSEQQQGASANIGESTVNPGGFWRRSVDGWHHGAGQTYYDRAESDNLRFRQSQGVDVFATRHQLTLLPTVSLAYRFSGGEGCIIVVGTHVYLMEASTGVVKYVAAPLTTPWTLVTVTGTAGMVTNPNHGLATDGYTVYIAAGNGSGVYTTTEGAAAAAAFVTGPGISSVWYVKGRLIAATGTDLYNPVAAGAAPTALMILVNGMSWKDVCGGPGFIYLMASNQSSTVIYKTGIKADGTALDVPTVAGELPAGEVGLGIFSYLGNVFVMSRGGVRMATIDANGNLIFGSLIPFPVASTNDYGGGFAAEDRFVYVSWRQATTSGVAKLDLSVEILPNTPAYAADLQDETGIARSVDMISALIYQGRLIYALNTNVSTSGIWVESTTPVASGHVDSGLIALDLADAKTPVGFDVEAAYPSTTSITEALSVDRGSSFTTVDTFTAANNDEAAVSGIAASRNFEIRTTLTSASATSPTLYRHTLKAEPAVSQGSYIIARLDLSESVVDYTGSATGRTPSTDRAALEALQASRAVVSWQEGSLTWNVTVRDLDWSADNRTASADDGSWNGVCNLRMKIVSAA